MLNMKTEFTEQDINDIKIFRSGTVFKLEGWANDVLVLKVEPANVMPETFLPTKRAMKLVDPMAGATKQLSANEKRALRSFAQAHHDLAALLTDQRVAAYANQGGCAQWASEILATINNPLWYKMPLQNMSDLGQALNNRMQEQPDKGLLREFQVALTGKGGLESLGKIVACDLFSGNMDRFNPGEGSKKTYGATTLAFRVVKNITNIFIGGTGTSRSLTGMDFIDPTAAFRWFSQTIAEVKSNYDVKHWSGEYLTSKSKRQKFCKDIIWDLNLILSGGKSQRLEESVFARKKTWLGGDAKDRLEAGMIAGGRTIRDGLTTKYRNDPNKPAGLDSRLAMLAQL